MLCNRLNIADNGYFTFWTITDIAGALGTISGTVCVGSPVIIIIYKKDAIVDGDGDPSNVGCRIIQSSIDIYRWTMLHT